MQLAGNICSICQKGVLLEPEATWCARCFSVLHRGCLTQSRGACPTCGTAYLPPEALFVYSKTCPECRRANDPPQPRCVSCKASTRWDTRAAYDEFVEHVKDTSRVQFIRGMAQLTGGLACLVCLLFRISVIFALGSVMLISGGIISLIKSWRNGRFS